MEKSFYTLSNEKNVTVVGEWKCLLDQTGSQYTLMSCIFEKIEKATDQLDPGKIPGSDEIPPDLVKQCKDSPS